MKLVLLLSLLFLSALVDASAYPATLRQPRPALLQKEASNDFLPISRDGNIPHRWTLYKQCDSKWANDKLGTGSLTICQAGCAMSSYAMALNTLNETLSGTVINPGTLNTWLIKNGGYVDGNLLVWASADRLGKMKFNHYYTGYKSLSPSDLQSHVEKGDPVVVNVRDGSHWVLVIGYQNSTQFYVNDPGFSNTYYMYSDMGNFVVYSI